MSFNMIFCLSQTPFVSAIIFLFNQRIDDGLQILLFYEDVQYPYPAIDHQQQFQQQIQREQLNIQPQQHVQQKSVVQLLKVTANPQSPQFLKSFHCNFSQKPIGLTQNQSNPIQDDIKKILKKSNSFDINLEEQRKTLNSQANIIQPTIATLDTEQQTGNRLKINTKLSKIPHQFIGCTDEVIVFETENNQQGIKNNNLNIGTKTDLYDIFKEEIYSHNKNSKKSESFTCKKQHINEYISNNSGQQEEKPQEQQQKQNLEESKDVSVQTCLICFEKEPDTVFMNCGHGGICYDCAILIWKNTSECYLCRQTIEQVYQVENKSNNKDKILKVISKTIKNNGPE